MYKLHGLLAVALAGNMFAAGAALADGGFYLSLDGGAAFFQEDDSYSVSANDANLPNPDTAIGGVDLDTGYMIGGAVGYDMGSGIRLEAEIAHRFGAQGSSRVVDYESGGGDNQTFLSEADITSTSVMAIANFDIATLFESDMGAFSPFVGIGLGTSNNEMGASSPMLASGLPLGTVPGDSHWDFAWKLTAGTGIKVGEKIYLDLAYAYTDLGTAEASDGVTLNYGVYLLDSGSIELQAHELSLGIRFLLY